MAYDPSETKKLLDALPAFRDAPMGEVVRRYGSQLAQAVAAMTGGDAAVAAAKIEVDTAQRMLATEQALHHHTRQLVATLQTALNSIAMSKGPASKIAATALSNVSANPAANS